MNAEKQLVELGVRELRLKNSVILMCERCGQIWSQDGLNSCACPKGCNQKKDAVASM